MSTKKSSHFRSHPTSQHIYTDGYFVTHTNTCLQQLLRHTGDCDSFCVFEIQLCPRNCHNPRQPIAQPQLRCHTGIIGAPFGLSILHARPSPPRRWSSPKFHFKHFSGLFCKWSKKMDSKTFQNYYFNFGINCEMELTHKLQKWFMKMMVFITFNSGLVPLIEGLCI